MLGKDNPLVKQAVGLPPHERLNLIDHLLESLDMPSEEIEQLWAEEATTRWEAYKTGHIESVSASEAFEKYRR